MANTFKVKKILGASGVFSSSVEAPNLVYNTGNQTIGGYKTFTGDNFALQIGGSGLEKLTVDGSNGRLFAVTDSFSGSLFSVNNIAGLPVIEAFDNNKVVMGAFNRNDFIITGNSVGIGALPSTGTQKLFVSGNFAVSGSSVFSIRPTVNGTGVLLSGEAATPQNLATTGSTLDTKINSLSGYSNSTFATITNLALTGSNLQTQINNLDLNYATDASVSGVATNLATTGSTLNTKIDNLSGYSNNIFATITNLASTGSTLNTRINSLSGYVNSASSNIVYTTGNQTISGSKTFAASSYVFSGANVIFTNNTGIVSGEWRFANRPTVNGTGVVLSGEAATPQNLATTGSTLDTKINSLSGYSNSNFATIANLALTGSTLNTRINSLSGYVNSASSNIVFTTGNQNISGNKNFIGTINTTGLVVSGLGTPFILKSPNNSNSVYFDPIANGNAGILFANYLLSSNLSSRDDNNFTITYGGGGTRYLVFSRGSVNRAMLDSNGNFGIASGISSVPSRFYVSGNSILQGEVTVSGNTTITGHLSAASKSFLIDHPVKSGKKLQYGSLESPYHGIRLTDKGKINSDFTQIDLPEYISALVLEEGVNVQLTNINHDKILFVKEVNIENNYFKVGMNRGWLDKNEYEFYWSFTAERKDIPKLTVEF
jgi:outer membrane murein-binding lipoprotein Lpp